MRVFLDLMKPNDFHLKRFFHKYAGLRDKDCKLKSMTHSIWMSSKFSIFEYIYTKNGVPPAKTYSTIVHVFR